MLLFKLHKYANLEESNRIFFTSLLEEIKHQGYFSPSIEEIIITDDIDGEIKRYCSEKLILQTLTKNREFVGISKIVEFNGKHKVFFDFENINLFVDGSSKRFFWQLLKVYGENIIAKNFPIGKQYSSLTPLPEILKIYFAQWASQIIAGQLIHSFSSELDPSHTDVKMFVDALKRNIRKLLFIYQKDSNLDDFWLATIKEIDSFIRRCLDVKYNKGNFGKLQEFASIVPTLLTEIETQVINVLEKKEVNIDSIHQHVLKILNQCSINVPNEARVKIEILENPKKIFKDIIDTEQRLVAFIDILGFSAIIEEYDSDKDSNILNELHDTLELAIKYSIENTFESKAKTDLKEYLEYRMFSDCICLSLPYIEFGNDFHRQFHSLSSIIRSYQFLMMQKGFFVRGGVSMGSYYSNKNMIFSGGLVSAYKLEQKATYPIIAIDKPVLERLRIGFSEKAKGLFYEDTALFMASEPEKIFLNPFEFLDNAKKYISFIQGSIKNIKSNKDSNDDVLTDQFVSLVESFASPVFKLLENQATPETLNAIKSQILELVQKELRKHEQIVSTKSIESKEGVEASKIIIKYQFLEKLTKWSMSAHGSNDFEYYQFD